MNDDELDLLLFEAAGVHDDDLRSPRSRAALHAAAEEVITMHIHDEDQTEQRDVLQLGRRTTGRPRRSIVAAAAAAAVGLIAVGVALVPGAERSGDGEVARPETTTPADDEEPVAIEAQIVSATRAAAAESIVVITQANVDGYRDTMWSDEVTGRMRIRVTGVDGTTVQLDTGPASTAPDAPVREVDHCFAEYTERMPRIPASGDPGTPDLAAEREIPPPRTEVERIASLIEEGAVVHDGTEVVDGRELLRLTWVEEERIMHVDPETMRPIRVLGYPGTEFEYVQTYEFVERTEETAALLVPPVPDGFVRVDELRGDGQRVDVGCL